MQKVGGHSRGEIHLGRHINVVAREKADQKKKED